MKRDPRQLELDWNRPALRLVWSAPLPEIDAEQAYWWRVIVAQLERLVDWCAAQGDPQTWYVRARLERRRRWLLARGVAA